jgi:hypothetical protein
MSGYAVLGVDNRGRVRRERNMIRISMRGGSVCLASCMLGLNGEDLRWGVGIKPLLPPRAVFFTTLLFTTAS